jgi:hypothetical protein
MPRCNPHAGNTKQDRIKLAHPGSHPIGHTIPHHPLPMHPFATFGPLHVNGANGVPFLLHPCAFGVRPNAQHGIDEDRAKDAPLGNGVGKVVTGKLDTGGEGHLVEQRVSQAAKQLYDQVSQSRSIYDDFHKSDEKDIERIGEYIGNDIQNRIWEEKVEQNRRHKTGLDQEDKQLTYQRDKLMTCLRCLSDAAAVLARHYADRLDHESRELQLEKIRAAGGRVRRLTKKAVSNEAACKDLITELDELWSLLDPENSTAKVLYRIDKREGQVASQPEEKDSDHVHSGSGEDPSSQKDEKENSAEEWNAANP